MKTAKIRKQGECFYVSFGITHKDGEFQVLKNGKFYANEKTALNAKINWENS